MKSYRVTKKTVTTRVEEGSISTKELRILLGLRPEDQLWVSVPGGGDWSNTGLSLDEHTLMYSITTVDEIEKDG